MRDLLSCGEPLLELALQPSGEQDALDLIEAKKRMAALGEVEAVGVE